MHYEGEAFFMGGVLGVIVGVVIGVGVRQGTHGSTDEGILQHQQTAIDAGHAEWVVDQKTGERAFKWKSLAEVTDFPEEEAPK